MIEFFVLALVNMHGSTELASYNLVPQSILNAMLWSLKGMSMNISLHTMLKKLQVLQILYRHQAFFA